MPHYDYICMDCGNKFEVFQSMAADPLETCENCSGKLKRLIGPGAGFVFKGAPVSETDYRLSASYKEGEKKESSSSTGTSGKKETKVAAKAPSNAE